MPRDKIIAMVLESLGDHRAHDIQEVVDSAIRKSETVPQRLYVSDVRSAVLGLVRRNQVELTDDFKVKLPPEKFATV